MTVQLILDAADVNAILEGLSRVAENARRIQREIHKQAVAQVQADPQSAHPPNAEPRGEVDPD